MKNSSQFFIVNMSGARIQITLSSFPYQFLDVVGHSRIERNDEQVTERESPQGDRNTPGIGDRLQEDPASYTVVEGKINASDSNQDEK